MAFSHVDDVGSTVWGLELSVPFAQIRLLADATVHATATKQCHGHSTERMHFEMGSKPKSSETLSWSKVHHKI